ncbi:MAG TPA: excalibur calcium-binding domain-containing protein [Pseudomonas sp.]|nr:excalibur calcium-binding domain-containing protein [Pseudomonas sp.]
MKKILIALAIGYVAWHYYLKPPESPVITNIADDGSLLSAPVIQAPEPTFLPIRSSEPARAAAVPATNFRCDGRTYCSQMRSCEEATYFLRNCPGVKMDGGDGQGVPNGIPCERQWCH